MGIQISSDDVLHYADQLKSLEGQVNEIFHDVKSRMNHMNAAWSSPASQALMNQFNALRPVFDSYVKALDDYAVYLNRTAVSYQENEQVLQSRIR